MLDLYYPWIFGLGGLLIAVSLFVWSLSSGDRGRVIGAVIGAVIGGGAGYVILTASNQSGIASVNGFLFSIALGAIVAGLVIYGILSTTRRAAALLTAGTMIAAAVAVSQLAVALTGE